MGILQEIEILPDRQVAYAQSRIRPGLCDWISHMKFSGILRDKQIT